MFRGEGVGALRRGGRRRARSGRKGVRRRMGRSRGAGIYGLMSANIGMCKEFPFVAWRCAGGSVLCRSR